MVTIFHEIIFLTTNKIPLEIYYPVKYIIKLLTIQISILRSIIYVLLGFLYSLIFALVFSFIIIESLQITIATYTFLRGIQMVTIYNMSSSYKNMNM